MDGLGIVIYDGECGVCNECRLWTEARDRGGRLAFVASQTADLPAISPGLTRAMTLRMAYFVRADGARYGCALAIFETLKRLPGIWGALGWIGANPAISLLCEPYYRIFAANRHRVSAMLGLTMCRVPSAAHPTRPPPSRNRGDIPGMGYVLGSAPPIGMSLAC